MPAEPALDWEKGPLYSPFFGIIGASCSMIFTGMCIQ